MPRCNLMYVQETLVCTLSLELSPSRSWAVTSCSAMLWHVAPFLQSQFLGETEHLPCTHSLCGCYREVDSCGPCPTAQKTFGSWGISCPGLITAAATSSPDRPTDVRQCLCASRVWGNCSSSGMSHACFLAACLVPCCPLAAPPSRQGPLAPREGCRGSCLSCPQRWCAQVRHFPSACMGEMQPPPRSRQLPPSMS